MRSLLDAWFYTLEEDVLAEGTLSAVADFPGVTGVADSFIPGKRELKLDLTPEGRALGLTLDELARQVRQGFFGEEAQRIQRGRDDVRVMVRYPEAERRSRGDVEAMRVRLGDDGTEVPITTVATAEEGRGFATIDRVDRLTTFLGLSPMILETSLQAQFLIPMALSLGFGIVFATFITLFLVPVIYRILEDLHRLFASTTVEEALDTPAPGTEVPAAASPA